MRSRRTPTRRSVRAATTGGALDQRGTRRTRSTLPGRSCFDTSSMPASLPSRYYAASAPSMSRTSTCWTSATPPFAISSACPKQTSPATTTGCARRSPTRRPSTSAAQHFDGLLAPSAALPGRRTLVIFAAGMAKVTVVSSRVRQPPPRLADLMRDIRVHRDVPAAVRSYLRSVASAGSDAIRRRR